MASPWKQSSSRKQKWSKRRGLSEKQRTRKLFRIRIHGEATSGEVQTSSGYKIVYLIHKSDDFAIYLDEETAVIDGTTAVEAKLSAIASEVASVQSHLPKEKGECDKINRQVAKAMWLCAVDKPDEGPSVIERVTDRFIADVRLIYLLSLWARARWSGLLEGCIFSSVRAALFPAFFGFRLSLWASPALCFLLWRTKREIPVDLNNSTFMHCATGASRTLVGLIAGAVCLL